MQRITNCSEENQLICNHNTERDCGGSCLLLPGVIPNVEVNVMTDEYEKVDTTLENVLALEIGDEVSGELISIEEGNYGPNYKIKTSDGEKLLFGKTILNTAMKKIQPGQQVKIKRVEDITTGTGRTAQNFEVFFKK